jgi:pimeloyl-ACP methyl ester carboxylesterase
MAPQGEREARTSRSSEDPPRARGFPKPTVEEESGSWLSFYKLGDTYTSLWKAIIRPPRDQYTEKALGPKVLMLEGKSFQRRDLALQSRGLTLQCSHFEPVAVERPKEKMPCVIYLHGNSSSRCEALSVLPALLPHGITVFALDLGGSGQSDGEYVSLGFFEREDLAVVVDHLRESGTVDTIGIWGRSMGAVTALLHGDRDPSIAGMVLDSPFSELTVLAEELAQHFLSVPLPKWLLGMVLSLLRSSVQQRAGFDLHELVPRQHVGKSFIPVLFAVAEKDTFIRPHHGRLLHDLYAGDKNIITVRGDHNSPRDSFFLNSATFFFLDALRIDDEGR